MLQLSFVDTTAHRLIVVPSGPLQIKVVDSCSTDRSTCERTTSQSVQQDEEDDVLERRRGALVRVRVQACGVTTLNQPCTGMLQQAYGRAWQQ